MKLMVYTDEGGYNRRVMVKDGDESPEFGIPQDIPDLNGLDWDSIKRELHNELTSAGVITWQDVQKSNNLMSIVNIIFKRRLINLYKLEAR